MEDLVFSNSGLEFKTAQVCYTEHMLQAPQSGWNMKLLQVMNKWIKEVEHLKS